MQTTTCMGCSPYGVHLFAIECRNAKLIKVLENWEVWNHEAIMMKDRIISELRMMQCCAGRTNQQAGTSR